MDQPKIGQRNSEIFDGESFTVMQHVSAKGWRQQHVPMFGQDAEMSRGYIELKQCPLVFLILENGQAKSKAEAILK